MSGGWGGQAELPEPAPQSCTRPGRQERALRRGGLGGGEQHSRPSWREDGTGEGAKGREAGGSQGWGGRDLTRPLAGWGSVLILRGLGAPKGLRWSLPVVERRKGRRCDPRLWMPGVQPAQGPRMRPPESCLAWGRPQLSPAPPKGWGVNWPLWGESRAALGCVCPRQPGQHE